MGRRPPRSWWCQYNALHQSPGNAHKGGAPIRPTPTLDAAPPLCTRLALEDCSLSMEITVPLSPPCLPRLCPRLTHRRVGHPDSPIILGVRKTPALGCMLSSLSSSTVFPPSEEKETMPRFLEFRTADNQTILVEVDDQELANHSSCPSPPPGAACRPGAAAPCRRTRRPSHGTSSGATSR